MDKATKRALKLAAAHDPAARQALKQSLKAERNRLPELAPIDCACVIHGSVYSWDYVERLYSMLTRHITPGVRLHVYTETDRPVPGNFIKHGLTDWHINGPKKSWWYKMQLFNTEHYAGPLLYFDLDVVIAQNIDWIWQLDPQHFWAVRDFKYLWRPTSYNINSSVMRWDTRRYGHIYEEFARKDFATILKKYRGDQDYITDCFLPDRRRFFDIERVASWRWQAFDGGYDHHKRIYRHPGTGTQLAKNNSILIFHGQPKPDSIQDPLILEHWK
jgi:hypothetical protein